MDATCGTASTSRHSAMRWQAPANTPTLPLYCVSLDIKTFQNCDKYKSFDGLQPLPLVFDIPCGDVRPPALPVPGAGPGSLPPLRWPITGAKPAPAIARIAACAAYTHSCDGSARLGLELQLQLHNPKRQCKPVCHSRHNRPQDATAWKQVSNAQSPAKYVHKGRGRRCTSLNATAVLAHPWTTAHTEATAPELQRGQAVP